MAGHQKNEKKESDTAFVLGIVLPIALLFLLYQFGFLGAGDIKLFAALGAFIGMEVWRIVLYSFLFGGVLSLLYMVKNVWIPWLKHRRRRRHRRNKIHFSMAILLGCLLYCQWG